MVTTQTQSNIVLRVLFCFDFTNCFVVIPLVSTPVSIDVEKCFLNARVRVENETIFFFFFTVKNREKIVFVTFTVVVVNSVLLLFSTLYWCC